ncbi:MAG: hypothetical protein ACW964_08170, partial [Candidatus Hodarchaeales archaeon]
LCPQCNIFEKSILFDPEIEKFLFEHFIPMFIDVNEYPDLYDRYSETVFPVHTIHSIMGGLLGDCTSISSPHKFLSSLKQLNLLKPRLTDFSYGFGIQPQNRIILDDSYHFHKKLDLIAEITLSSLLKRFDRMYGGWDLGGIKFHPSSALEFLLLFYHRSRDEHLLSIIINTLRASFRGLKDRTKGGFFEYSNRDWSSVGSRQKTLPNNIAIARNLFHAYLVTNDEYYLNIIHNILNFVFENLWTDSNKFFMFSIRENAESTLINDIYIAKPNCDICSFLIEAKEIIEENKGDMYYFPRIELTIENLKNATTENGIPHMLINSKINQYLLKDQTAYLDLILQQYTSNGDNNLLLEGEKMLKGTISNFLDENIGLFQDRISFRDQDFGPLEKSLYPVRENAFMVDSLVTYSYLSAEPYYFDLATRCVTSYYSNFGISRDAPYPPEFVFANQRLIESPIELLIVGSPKDKTVRKMLLEMKKIYDPFKIIQILDPENSERLIKKKLPDIQLSNKPAAFIKIENTISPPAFFPREISKMIQTILDAIPHDLD